MTRFRLLLPAVGLLALTAAACAGGADEAVAPPAAGACLEGSEDCQDTGGDMGAPDAPDTDEPAGEATEAQPKDGLENVRAIGWDRVEVDPDDQTRVTVFWWSGVEPCNALSGVEAELGDEAVVLTVMEGSEPADEPQACIEIAVYKQTTITLDEAVGPRSIVDGTEA